MTLVRFSGVRNAARAQMAAALFSAMAKPARVEAVSAERNAATVFIPKSSTSCARSESI